jgi:tetratricopeptide (TPR) repeat protein
LLVFVMSILLATGLGDVAHAQSANTRADEQLSRGQRLFQEGKYADAIEELRAGYVLAPQPRFLYALGQAYRLNHQCKEAVKAYREFIASNPSQTQVAASEQNVQRCGEEDPSSLVEEPVKPATPEVKPQTGVPLSTDAAVVAAPPPRTPTYKKWWPWTILTVGVVGVGLGVGLGIGLTRKSNSFNPTLMDVGPNAAH